MSTLPARPTGRAGGDSASVSNLPGDRRLQGAQSPSLVIERVAPEEVQVGKTARFTVHVRNEGAIPVHGVVLRDQVPRGTRLIAANPPPQATPDGQLFWDLGTVDPNEDVVIHTDLMPEAEGELGSVAEVQFRAAAAVRTISTKPVLKLTQSGPAKALIGEEIPYQISVSNTGSGVARGVVVEVDVPEGLAHDGGREIMTDPFDLRPNEARTFDLVLRAVKPGTVPNVARAVAGEALKVEHRSQVEIIAPGLEVGINGPTRRFLDRPVKYQVVVTNPGTAVATEVELSLHLPRGLQFTSADNRGRYDEATHSVFWSLETLPLGEQGIVEVTAVPTAPGEQKLRVEGRAALGLQHEFEHATVVEEITDLAFTVTDDNVPIEVGSETTYLIRVANNGTKVARNVKLAVQVPKGMEVTDAGGPTEVQEQGEYLVMAPIAALNPREEAVYRLVAKGLAAGDHILRVQLMSDEFSAPVLKEEITKVYADK